MLLDAGAYAGSERKRARERVGPALSQVTVGGDEGNRTLNPRLAKAVLCQLSYVPEGQDEVVASCQTSRAGRWSRRRRSTTAAPAARASVTSAFTATLPHDD